MGTESPSLLILALLGATVGLPYFLLSTTSPAGTGVVCAQLSWQKPLSLVRAVEPGVDAGPARLSRGLEPWGHDSAPVLWLVACICRVRFALRGMRMVQSAPATREFRIGSQRRRARGRRAPCENAPGAVGGARGNRVVSAARGDESSVPEHLVDPAALGRAAVDLSAHIHSLFRRPAAGIGRKSSRPSSQLRSSSWRGTLADHGLAHKLELQIGVFCVGLFLACMFCHGELARLKPAPR